MSDPVIVGYLYVVTLAVWMELSVNALAIFEYVTTFDQEITSIWERKPSGASILLFAVRYTMLCTAILSIIEFGTLNLKECTGVSIMFDILVLLGCIQTAAFSALRVYALCGGGILLAVAIFLLQLAPVVTNAYAYHKSPPVVDPLLGCYSHYKLSNTIHDILIYTSRIPLTIGDALVVAITWMKSFQQLRIQHTTGVRFSLSTLLFRDGTAYFLLLLVLNVLEVSPLTATRGGPIVGSLASILPLILVNRFIMNLRQLSDSEARPAAHMRTISTPMFRVTLDIAGNIGEPLEHGWEATSDDGELGIEEAVLDDGGVADEGGVDIEEVPRNTEVGALGHQVV